MMTRLSTRAELETENENLKTVIADIYESIGTLLEVAGLSETRPGVELLRYLATEGKGGRIPANHEFASPLQAEIHALKALVRMNWLHYDPQASRRDIETAIDKAMAEGRSSAAANIDGSMNDRLRALLLRITAAKVGRYVGIAFGGAHHLLTTDRVGQDAIEWIAERDRLLGRPTRR